MAVAALLAVILGAAYVVLSRRDREAKEPVAVAPPVSPSSAPAPTPGARKARPPKRTPRDSKVAEPLPVDFEAGEPEVGLIAVVIDDMGNEDGSLERMSRLDGPLAISVLPDTPRARQAAELGRRKGWTVLVHLPMAGTSQALEPRTIGASMDDVGITSTVESAIDKVPGAIGLNNHQGSVAMSDLRVVRAVLSVVGRRGLFFLDSRTTPTSVGEAEARRLGVPVLQRGVFLDDAQEGLATPGGAAAALEAAWVRALRLVEGSGSCIAIGHPHAETVRFLKAKLSEARSGGPRFVRVSDLLR